MDSLSLTAPIGLMHWKDFQFIKVKQKAKLSLYLIKYRGMKTYPVLTQYAIKTYVGMGV